MNIFSWVPQKQEAPNRAGGGGGWGGEGHVGVGILDKIKQAGERSE